jgi:FixJ family two-component response regulator
VVLDVHLPGLSGLDLQEELNSRGLDPAIVFITGFGTVPMSVQAMKNGAIDFLQKPFQEQDLLAAIRQALDSNARSRLAAEQFASLQARYSLLTPREREVFELVARGLLNKQVASRLGTSEKTVKVHRGRVMHKMKADSLADLVRMSERFHSEEKPVWDQGLMAPQPDTV